MRQRIVYHETLKDEQGRPIEDKYGRPQTVRWESLARVQRRSRVVTDARGTERRITLEIDLPPDINPEVGLELEFEEPGGEWGKGTIVTKDEAINLTGTRVFYRTVFVDG